MNSASNWDILFEIFNLRFHSRAGRVQFQFQFREAFKWKIFNTARDRQDSGKRSTAINLFPPSLFKATELVIHYCSFYHFGFTPRSKKRRKPNAFRSLQPFPKYCTKNGAWQPLTTWVLKVCIEKNNVKLFNSLVKTRESRFLALREVSRKKWSCRPCFL